MYAVIWGIISKTRLSYLHTQTSYISLPYIKSYNFICFDLVCMLEMIANSILATVASAICCIVSIYNSRNPTQAKTATVAFLIMFSGKK